MKGVHVYQLSLKIELKCTLNQVFNKMWESLIFFENFWRDTDLQVLLSQNCSF